MCVLRIPVKDTVSIQFNNYMYHTKNEKKKSKKQTTTSNVTVISVLFKTKGNNWIAHIQNHIHDKKLWHVAEPLTFLTPGSA